MSYRVPPYRCGVSPQAGDQTQEQRANLQRCHATAYDADPQITHGVTNPGRFPPWEAASWQPARVHTPEHGGRLLTDPRTDSGHL